MDSQKGCSVSRQWLSKAKISLLHAAQLRVTLIVGIVWLAQMAPAMSLLDITRASRVNPPVAVQLVGVQKLSLVLSEVNLPCNFWSFTCLTVFHLKKSTQKNINHPVISTFQRRCRSDATLFKGVATSPQKAQEFRAFEPKLPVTNGVSWVSACIHSTAKMKKLVSKWQYNMVYTYILVYSI